MHYPLAKPNIGKKEERYALEALRSGVLSIGPKVEAFERRFARFVRTKHAVAVSSGTAGLHLSLIAAGIGKGDEVITPPFSFVASANAILYVGAKPVFVDVDPYTYNIDPAHIEAAITPKTKALLIVHILGQAADMDPIVTIARKHRLRIIEDACESLGALYRGRDGKERMVGTFGESAVFAFYPNKQMTTGEGGMIVTNDAKLDALFRSLRNQGRGENMNWLHHERLGYNYRLPELSAAVGLAQIERIAFLIRERQRVARWYSAALASHRERIETPRTASGNTHTWFVYTVLLPKGVSRKNIIERLKKANIATKPYLPSIHLMSFYRKQFGFSRGDFPVSEEVSSRILALPFYIGLAKRDIAYICRELLKAVS